ADGGLSRSGLSNRVGLALMKQAHHAALSSSDNSALGQPSLKGPDIVGLIRIVPILERDLEALSSEGGSDPGILRCQVGRRSLNALRQKARRCRLRRSGLIREHLADNVGDQGGELSLRHVGHLRTPWLAGLAL